MTARSASWRFLRGLGGSPAPDRSPNEMRVSHVWNEVPSIEGNESYRGGLLLEALPARGRGIIEAIKSGRRASKGTPRGACVYTRYRVLFRTMDDNPSVVHGAFLWDSWMASDELWNERWNTRRSFSIRGKPAGEAYRLAATR